MPVWMRALFALQRTITNERSAGSSREPPRSLAAYRCTKPRIAAGARAQTSVGSSTAPYSLYDTDLELVRGPVSDTPAENPAMRTHFATLRSIAPALRIAPRTWTRVVTPDGTWLVWQVIESIRPDAPPPPPNTPRDARLETTFVWEPASGPSSAEAAPSGG